MIRTMNALPLAWPLEVWALWEAFEKPEGEVTNANWFTARPWTDKYNRGSDHEGFVYTINRKVYVMEWLVDKPAKAYRLPKTKPEDVS